MSWAIKQNLNYLNVLEHQRKIPHDSVMWGQIQTQCIGFYYITRLHRISNGNGTSNSSRSKVTFGQLELEVPFWDSILFHSTLKSTSHQRTKGNIYGPSTWQHAVFVCLWIIRLVVHPNIPPGPSSATQLKMMGCTLIEPELVMIGLKLVNLRANHKLEGVFVVWLRHFLTGRGILYVLTFSVFLLTGTSLN